MSQVRMSSVSRVTAAGVLALALSFPALAQNVSLVSASAVTDGGILPANVLQRPANLRVHDVPLAAALLELRHSSGVALAYSPSLFPADRRVSCLCEARTVREALAHLLQGTEFRYSELGRMVLIEPKAALAGGGAAGSDLMLVLTSAVVKADEPAGSASRLEPRALPQEATIRGVVTDQRTGQPLEGAQVHFPRLALGTLTDNAGRFALSRVPAGQYELRAEYLGYASASQTVSITPGGALTVNFQLASSAIGLDEIVVTGTPGATQRRQLGVAVDQIRTSEFLETAPVVSVSELLSNRAAGVFIMSQGGQVGVGSIPKLRGTGSISLSNSPIIYVDGVRIDRTEITGPGGGSGPSRFDDIRPEDIE
ncbi:MAG: carboxypeptidase-like regulatory domain-containing protein, partial [Gemmatimonadetes bacterium]|nr:carboxypeptidase-like regulatory domain-containing protein [Gemmatimonadota bacterium]